MDIRYCACNRNPRTSGARFGGLDSCPLEKERKYEGNSNVSTVKLVESRRAASFRSK
jgi:hypothetical protein